MNKLLLLMLLASCTATPTENSTQKAVSDYLRKTLDDPSSYQAVRWSKEESYRQKDALNAQAQQLLQAAAGHAQLALNNERQVSRLSGMHQSLALALSAKAKALSDKYSRESDSLSRAAAVLQQSADTTRIGVGVMHVFRAKNKMGGLVLDSARFIVLKSGAVMRASVD